MIDVNGLRGDMVLSACLRYDLAPIPVTFEGKIRLTPEMGAAYQDGKTIKVNEIDFRIVKAEPVRNSGGNVQGKYPLSAVSITAFPEGCFNVAKPRRAAVIAMNAGFASLYRACGATVSVSGELNVNRFACFIGDTPTFHLARVLQEASAVMMWRSGRVQLMRIADLVAQDPVDDIDVESSEDVRSGFLEVSEIPTYFSVDARGKFVAGSRRDAMQLVSYAPWKSSSELNAMGKVLIRRKVIKSKPNIALRAGEVISVRGTPLVIMTAAHYFENNTDGGGANQYSRLWLGSL